MKKKAVIITIILMFICIQGYFFSCNNEKDLSFEEKVNGFLCSWMNYIIEDAQIKEIVMPGSHDACSYTMHSLAETQSDSIYTQLINGVRYFDIRVRKYNNEFVIYHSFVNGVSFSGVVSDLKRFITEYPGQFLILDFKTPYDEKEEIIEILYRELNFIENALPVSFNIGNLTIGSVRDIGAKYMVVFDGYKEGEYGDYIHLRKNTLISPYSELFHYDNDYLIEKGFPVYFNKSEEDKLFVLQAQRTANILITPRNMEESFRPFINEYLYCLDDEILLEKLNIVMRDYIDTDIENLKVILRLNTVKGLVDNNKTEEFMKILDNLKLK